MRFPSPGDLPDPEIEPKSPALAGGFFTTESPRKPLLLSCLLCYRENLKSTLHALPVTLPPRNVSTPTPFLTVFPPMTENGLSLLPKASPQPPLSTQSGGECSSLLLLAAMTSPSSVDHAHQYVKTTHLSHLNNRCLDSSVISSSCPFLSFPLGKLPEARVCILSCLPLSSS